MKDATPFPCKDEGYNSNKRVWRRARHEPYPFELIDLNKQMYSTPEMRLDVSVADTSFVDNRNEGFQKEITSRDMRCDILWRGLQLPEHVLSTPCGKGLVCPCYVYVIRLRDGADSEHLYLCAQTKTGEYIFATWKDAKNIYNRCTILTSDSILKCIDIEGLGDENLVLPYPDLTDMRKHSVKPSFGVAKLKVPIHSKQSQAVQTPSLEQKLRHLKALKSPKVRNARLQKRMHSAVISQKSEKLSVLPVQDFIVFKKPERQESGSEQISKDMYKEIDNDVVEEVIVNRIQNDTPHVGTKNIKTPQSRDSSRPNSASATTQPEAQKKSEPTTQKAQTLPVISKPPPTLTTVRPVLSTSVAKVIRPPLETNATATNPKAFDSSKNKELSFPKKAAPPTQVQSMTEVSLKQVPPGNKAAAPMKQQTTLAHAVTKAAAPVPQKQVPSKNTTAAPPTKLSATTAPPKARGVPEVMKKLADLPEKNAHEPEKKKVQQEVKKTTLVKRPVPQKQATAQRPVPQNKSDKKEEEPRYDSDEEPVVVEDDIPRENKLYKRISKKTDGAIDTPKKSPPVHAAEVAKKPAKVEAPMVIEQPTVGYDDEAGDFEGVVGAEEEEEEALDGGEADERTQTVEGEEEEDSDAEEGQDELESRILEFKGQPVSKRAEGLFEKELALMSPPKKRAREEEEEERLPDDLENPSQLESTEDGEIPQFQTKKKKKKNINNLTTSSITSAHSTGGSKKSGKKKKKSAAPRDGENGEPVDGNPMENGDSEDTKSAAGGASKKRTARPKFNKKDFIDQCTMNITQACIGKTDDVRTSEEKEYSAFEGKTAQELKDMVAHAFSYWTHYIQPTMRNKIPKFMDESNDPNDPDTFASNEAFKNAARVFYEVLAPIPEMGLSHYSQTAKKVSF